MNVQDLTLNHIQWIKVEDGRYVAYIMLTLSHTWFYVISKMNDNDFSFWWIGLNINLKGLWKDPFSCDNILKNWNE